MLDACPGVIASARNHPTPHSDDVWGRYRTMTMAWAADDAVRHRASTGGVLTALGQYALRSGLVDSVLHVGADPTHPIRSRSVISRTAEEVLANSGSRYGPTHAVRVTP